MDGWQEAKPMAHEGHETRIITRGMHHAKGIPLTRTSWGSTQDMLANSKGFGGNGCLKVGGAADEDNIHIFVKQYLHTKHFT